MKDLIPLKQCPKSSASADLTLVSLSPPWASSYHPPSYSRYQSALVSSLQAIGPSLKGRMGAGDCVEERTAAGWLRNRWQEFSIRKKKQKIAVQVTQPCARRPFRHLAFLLDCRPQTLLYVTRASLTLLSPGTDYIHRTCLEKHQRGIGKALGYPAKARAVWMA